MSKIYNDNELLYMILENNENAFGLLCEKYYPLIINRLKRFSIKKNFDDFFQEALMELHRCALTYREDKIYAFNNYFDISLQYKIRTLIRNDKDYFYNVSIVDVYTIDKHQEKVEEEKKGIILSDIQTRKLSEYEKLIYANINDGNCINEIANSFNLDKRSIYNAVSRIRKKQLTVSKYKKLSIESFFSPLEENVYQLLKLDYRPNQIATILNCSNEVIYNAVKRIKRKIKKHESEKN